MMKIVGKSNYFYSLEQLKHTIMNTFQILFNKKVYLAILILGIIVSSCSSYKSVSQEDDGIYAKASDKKEATIVEKDVVNKTTDTKDNYFARELDKYEDLEEDEILLDAEDYSSEENQKYEEESVESNASWGYENQEVHITHHISYDWYHPYHSSFYYGYNWGFYNWYNPYYYNPWRSYSYYGYYYNPFYYNGYYPYNYGYNNYGYGYYNPSYYGGYGYNYYNNYPRYNNRYGRRGSYNVNTGRRSLSRSVAGVTHRNPTQSIIRGSGTIVRPRTIAPRENNTVQPRTTTTPRNNGTVRPRTTSPRENGTVRPRTTPRNNGTVSPRTTTPRSNGDVRPRTTSPRNNTTRPRTTSTPRSTSRPKSTYTPRTTSRSSSSSGTRSSSSRSSSSRSSSGSSRSSSSSSRGRR
jgi:hypothetical protein